MKKYGVTLPIAGEAYVEVEANSEEEALEMAKSTVTLEDLQEWDYMNKVNSGNVCHFPFAWEASVEDLGEDQEDD